MLFGVDWLWLGVVGATTGPDNGTGAFGCSSGTVGGKAGVVDGTVAVAILFPSL